MGQLLEARGPAPNLGMGINIGVNGGVFAGGNSGGGHHVNFDF